MNQQVTSPPRELIRHANKRRLVRSYEEGNVPHGMSIHDATSEGRKEAIQVIESLQHEDDVERIEVYELATELVMERAWTAVQYLPEDELAIAPPVPEGEAS